MKYFIDISTYIIVLGMLAMLFGCMYDIFKGENK